MFRHVSSCDRKPRSHRRSFAASSHAAKLRSYLTLEHLEDRTVPSTIFWTNRGSGSSPFFDFDHFTAVFGARADLARSVVDTAISEWSRVITNFNQKDNGDNNHIIVTIAMDTSLKPGAASTTVTRSDANGKPLAATLTFGTGTWYLNPTLFPSSFLGTPTNAFAGYAQAGSPAQNQGDLLEVVTHELGHAMGFSSNSRINALCTDTGIFDTIDTNPGIGHYYAFTGTDGFRTLLTSYDSDGTDRKGGQHFAPAGASYTKNGTTYYGADDVMTPFYGSGQRRIVSYNDAEVLKNAMGYDVRDPDAALGDFYAVFDETGKLTVRGGPAGPNGDSLTVLVTANQQYVQATADLHNVAPGTSSSSGFGLYSKLFIPVNSVKSIEVVGGGSGTTVAILTAGCGAPVSITNRGNLTVNVDGNGGPVTITGAGPSTKVTVGSIGGHVLTKILADVSVSTTAGPIDLTVDDYGDTVGRTVTLSDTAISYGGPQISYPRNGMKSLTLIGGTNTSGGGNQYTIRDTPAAPAVTMLRTRGSYDQVSVRGTSGTLNIDSKDTSAVYLGDNGRLTRILGSVYITNSHVNGTDLLIFNSNDTGNGTFAFGPTLIFSSEGPPINYAANALNVLEFSGGTGTNLYTIAGTPDFPAGCILHPRGAGDRVRVLANTTPLTISGQAANRVEIGNNGRLTDILKDVTIGGPVAPTSLVIDDSADPNSPTATITSSTVSYGNPNATIRFTNLDSLTVQGGPGGGPFNVQSTPAGTSVTVNAGTGNNAITVGNPANRLDGILGPLTINGQGGTDTLIINDQGTTSSKGYEMYATLVKRIVNPSVVPVVYDAVVNYANVQTLNVNGSSGGDIWYIYGTAAGTNANLNSGAVAGASADEFEIGADSNALLGPLALHVQSGTNSYMVYYDYQNAAAQAYTLTAGTVSRSGLALVTYDSLAEVILYAASIGGNTINVPSLAAGVFDNLATADGDTVTIGANQTLAAVLGRWLSVPRKITAAARLSSTIPATSLRPQSPLLLATTPITVCTSTDWFRLRFTCGQHRIRPTTPPC